MLNKLIDLFLALLLTIILWGFLLFVPGLFPEFFGRMISLIFIGFGFLILSWIYITEYNKSYIKRLSILPNIIAIIASIICILIFFYTFFIFKSTDVEGLDRLGGVFFILIILLLIVLPSTYIINFNIVKILKRSKNIK